MLTRATGEIDPGIWLSTLGPGCHYLLGDGVPTGIIDGVFRTQIPALGQRLEQQRGSLAGLRSIYVTHLHGERVGGIPYLMELASNLTVYVSSAARVQLGARAFVESIYQSDRYVSSLFPGQPGLAPAEMAFDEYFDRFQDVKVHHTGDRLDLDGGHSLRVVAFPGHTAESVAYLLSPHQLLFTDDGMGYYRGTRLLGPGGDYSLTRLIEGVQRVQNLEISALALPFEGMVTGSLVQKTITALVQNTKDLIAEAGRAHEEGVSREDIEATIWETLYAPERPNTLTLLSLERTFNGICRQLRESIDTPELAVLTSEAGIEGSSSNDTENGANTFGTFE